MSESRTFPRFLPRPGHKISITIGKPINTILEPYLLEAKKKFPIPWKPNTYDQDFGEDLKLEPDELKGIRSRIAEVLREEVMKVGIGSEKIID